MRKGMPQAGHELRQIIRRRRIVKVRPAWPALRLQISQQPSVIPALDDALEREDHQSQQRQDDLGHDVDVLVLLMSRKDKVQVSARPLREAFSFVTARHAIRRSGPSSRRRLGWWLHTLLRSSQGPPYGKQCRR